MDIVLELRPKDGELKFQRNDPDSTATRENAVEVDPNPYTLANIRIETVQYGQYDGKPAALLLLRFIFKYRPGFARIRSFHVDIEFGKYDSGDPSRDIRVMKLEPQDRLGEIFTEERTETVTAGAELGTSGVKPVINAELANKFNRTYQLKLNGWIAGTETVPDCLAVWDCVEAKKKAKGVVPKFLGAIIVRYPKNELFQAKFRMNAQQGQFNMDTKLFDWKSVLGRQKETDDPVIFDPGQPLGKQFGDCDDFRDLDIDNIIALEPIPVLPSGYS
ncbi:hypothetical protein CPB86DRAFT_817188 [Serendipita vermifera]|nr:hypothetical protein CPB86DRAFT_817188 [Serendipita vermifera]